MVNFFGIFAPSGRHEGRRQQPFFSDDWQLSRGERDATLLNGKLPPQPDHQLADRDESYHTARFVSLLSPPYF